MFPQSDGSPGEDFQNIGLPKLIAVEDSNIQMSGTRKTYFKAPVHRILELNQWELFPHQGGYKD